MATFDSPALKMQLTPEVAIDLAQKEVKRRGWGKFDLSDILTVYTPFYVFSFDVIAEGGAPPGKAALNASTGEINEFVPVLLERPIAKEKKTPANMQVEVEATNIRIGEVEKIAALKVANMLGTKKENVAISAVSKIYVPFFRMWIDVAGDSFKTEVDGCLGYPTGLDALPQREKTWSESASSTVEKMRSPSGILQLLQNTFNEIGKLLGGKSGGKQFQWVALIAAIAVIGFLIFQQFGTKTSCEPDEAYLSRPEFLGIFGKRNLFPQEVEQGTMLVQGTCKFSSREDDNLIIGQVIVNKDGFPIGSTTVNATTISGREVERSFEITFPREETPGNYELVFEKIVG